LVTSDERTKNILTSHVEEIETALKNKLTAEEIERELRTYLEEYMVPLSIAKRCIVRKHGGDPLALKISDEDDTYNIVSHHQPPYLKAFVNNTITANYDKTKDNNFVLISARNVQKSPAIIMGELSVPKRDAIVGYEMQGYTTNSDYMEDLFRLMDLYWRLAFPDSEDFRYFRSSQRRHHSRHERTKSESEYRKRRENLWHDVKLMRDTIMMKKELARTRGIILSFDEFVDRYGLDPLEEIIVLLLLQYSLTEDSYHSELRGKDILDVLKAATGNTCTYAQGQTYLRPTSKLRKHGLIIAKGKNAMPIIYAEFEITEKAVREIYDYELCEGPDVVEIDDEPSLDRRMEREKPVEIIEPKVDLDDVVLPETIKNEIKRGLAQVERSKLIFEDWGFQDKFRQGKGLNILFSGPPGTGKTFTAEAIAHRLGRKLEVADYSKIVNCYIGETGKNIREAFRDAEKHNAVLLLDEADAIVSSRVRVDRGVDHEFNRDVSILMQEMEKFNGVLILTTNLSTNLDRAIERRLNLKIIFPFPDVNAREKIWRLHIPAQAPLSADVNLRVLAERFKFTGAQIKNAVLSAARIAAQRVRPGSRQSTKICMDDFIKAAKAEEEGAKVMQYNLVQDVSRDYKTYFYHS
jgi:AAA+ superfamily predicted ATPase